MDQRQLKLNETKTEYMIVGSRYKIRQFGDFNIIINGNPINVVDKIRDFGDILDNNLSLSFQVNNVTSEDCWISYSEIHFQYVNSLSKTNLY